MPAQLLREYQKDAIRALQIAWGRKPTDKIKAVAFCATGLGKTTIFSQLVAEEIDPAFNRALLFVHRREIVDQIAARVKNQCDEFPPLVYSSELKTLVPSIGIVMGNQNAYNARVVVSTIQSLHPKRLEQVLGAGKIDLVIVDECHHLSGDNTYHKTLKAIQANNPAVKIAGFTATPTRSDKKAIAAGFDQIVFEYGIVDGIVNGYLVPATRLQVSSGIDLSGVATVAGDYHKKQMLSVLDASNWLQLSVEAYETYLKGKRNHVLAFMPTVQMSKQLVAGLQGRGVKAAHIDATTDKAIRAEILNDFRRGELQVVSNYNILTEGFDSPNTDGILLGRPSRSESVITQIIGRGLRPDFGKTDCLVVDLTVKDTRLLINADLTGKTRKCGNCKAEVFIGLKVCPNCSAILEQKRKLEARETEGEKQYKAKFGILAGLSAEVVPLLDRLTAAWYRHSDQFLVSRAGENAAFVIAPPSFEPTEATRDRLHRADELLPVIAEEDRPYLIDNIETLQRMVARAEQFTLYHVEGKKVTYLRANSDLPSLITEADLEAVKRAGKAALKLIKRGESWRTNPIRATPKQVNFLLRIGRNLGKSEEEFSRLTKGQADDLITYCLHVPPVKRFIEFDQLGSPNAEPKTA